MLNIISAEDRLKEKRGHKIVVCGPSGVGKTTLVRTLDSDKTLFMDLEVMSTESERWNIFKGMKDKDRLFESIQNFMFSFQIRDKNDIEKFLTQANETSLALFKKNKDFIDDYVETPEMSKKLSNV